MDSTYNLCSHLKNASRDARVGLTMKKLYSKIIYLSIGGEKEELIIYLANIIQSSIELIE